MLWTKDEDDSKRVPEYRYLCYILFGPQEAEQCSHPITEIMCRRRHRPKEDEDNTVHYSIAAWRDRQTDRSYETMAWNHENWTKKHFKCLRRRTWWIVTKKTMMSSANNILLFFVVFGVLLPGNHYRLFLAPFIPPPPPLSNLRLQPHDRTQVTIK